MSALALVFPRDVRALLESETVRFLTIVAALVLATTAIRRIVALQRLLKGTFTAPRVRVLADGDVGEVERERLAPAVRELAREGFVPVAYAEVRPLDALLGPAVEVLLEHPATRTLAWVGRTRPVDWRNRYAVELETQFADGRLAWTPNAALHAVPGGAPAGSDALDPLAGTLAEQWAAHRTVLAARGASGTPVRRDPAGAAVERGERWRAHLERLVARGWLEPVRGTPAAGEPAVLRPTLRGGLRWVNAFVRGATRAEVLFEMRRSRLLAERAAGRPGTTALCDPDVPVADEVDAFYAIDAFARRPARRAALLWLLVGSGLLFVASFAHLFSPLTLLLLVAVVFVHELGHLTAMRLCGYENVSIFFLPFLGAATVGLKREASVRDELLVLFAGPLPGLVVAGALLVGLPLVAAPLAEQDAWLRRLFWMLLGLNGLNLLPFLPLDGGRIVSTLLFSGNRWAEMGFKLATGVPLGALALLVGDVLLGLLAFVVLGSIPGGLRTAELRAVVRAALASPGARGRDPVEVALVALRGTGAALWPTARKVALLRTAGSVLWAPAIGWTTRLAWLVVYGTCLGGALLLALAGGLLGLATSL